MSKQKITIVFKNIHQLWNYAQKINATNIEIRTAEMILICDCSERDLELLSNYNGKVLKEYAPIRNQGSHHQN